MDPLTGGVDLLSEAFWPILLCKNSVPRELDPISVDPISGVDCSRREKKQK